MIKAITVTNHLGDSIELELTRPDKTGFLIKSIDGLGPVKANINTTVNTTGHGEKYNSARLDKRNIVMNIEFMQTDHETIEEIRHKSYKYFPQYKNVKLLIETDKYKVTTSGYVETNDVNIFSNREDTSISIICPDPFLYSTEINETVFSGAEPMFEFPFSNESLEEPLIEFASIENNNQGTVYYEGDSDIGVDIVIHAIGDVQDLTIYNVTNNEKLRIDTSKIPTTFLPTEAIADFEASVDCYQYGKPIAYAMVSDYIPVSPNTKLIYSVGLGCFDRYVSYDTWAIDEEAAWSVRYYDSNKNCIGYVYHPFVTRHYWKIDSSTAYYYSGGVTGFNETVPENAAYVRFRHVSTQPSVSDASFLVSRAKNHIAEGDTIHINTNKHNKSITLLRDGVTFNILNSLDRDVKWFTLSRGDNIFLYQASEGETNLQFAINNRIVYNGV